MSELARILISLGIFLVIVGLMLLAIGKIPWMGRLPGDILIRKGNFTFYFPLATCILISLILTLFLWILGHGGKR
jgi:uncharacterized membrane protein YidH (DUF202 family)